MQTVTRISQRISIEPVKIQWNMKGQLVYPVRNTSCLISSDSCSLSDSSILVWKDHNRKGCSFDSVGLYDGIFYPSGQKSFSFESVSSALTLTIPLKTSSYSPVEVCRDGDDTYYETVEGLIIQTYLPTGLTFQDLFAKRSKRSVIRDYPERQQAEVIAEHQSWNRLRIRSAEEWMLEKYDTCRLKFSLLNGAFHRQDYLEYAQISLGSDQVEILSVKSGVIKVNRGYQLLTPKIYPLRFCNGTLVVKDTSSSSEWCLRSWTGVAKDCGHCLISVALVAFIIPTKINGSFLLSATDQSLHIFIKM